MNKKEKDHLFTLFIASLLMEKVNNENKGKWKEEAYNIMNILTKEIMNVKD
jgi:hypothetical protein